MADDPYSPGISAVEIPRMLDFTRKETLNYNKELKYDYNGIYIVTSITLQVPRFHASTVQVSPSTRDFFAGHSQVSF